MKEVKKYIDAIWTYKDNKYVLIDEAVSKKIFQKNYKEKVQLFYLKELLKEVSGLNTKLLDNIKNSTIIKDPLKVMIVLKSSLKSGSFAGTTEHLLNKLEDIVMPAILLWLILAVICLPLALIVLVLFPLIWLISIPFRLLGIAVEGVFEFLRALIMLPARLIGGGRR